MKIKYSFVAPLILFCMPAFSSGMERIVVDTGDISLQPKSSAGNDILLVKSFYIPPVCQLTECNGPSTITMFNGSQLDIRTGTKVFYSVVDGIDFEVRLKDASVHTLANGKGGEVEITIRQGVKPYISGGFSIPLFNYNYTDTSNANVSSVYIDVNGFVKSGGCIINDGKNLSFHFDTTIKELNNLRGGRRVVDAKNIVFDCVNVSSIDMYFSSVDVDSFHPERLIDKNTGASTIFEYDTDGRRSDVFWDNSKNSFFVNNDSLTMTLRMYVIGGNVTPGPFSINGIYNVEYK